VFECILDEISTTLIFANLILWYYGFVLMKLIGSPLVTLPFCLNELDSTRLMFILQYFFPSIIVSVPTLFEERCQQASDYAPETQEVQESHYTGLQDPRTRTDKYG